MAKPVISTKRVAISKANAQMVGIVGGAVFLSIFCLFAAKSVFSQNQYQAKVTSAKDKAHRQLVKNIAAYETLQGSYEKFDNESTNIIGGSRNGNGSNDGTNSKIVLNALPSTYDFPALASSLEKILKDNNVKISGITGTDDQVAQQGNISSPTPTAVEMPFTFSVDNANYESINKLVTALQRSTRPIVVDKIAISGGGSNMSLTVNAHTYYQPSKTLNIQEKVQK